jgi:DNA-binding HxlR family transcriptional regulator
MKRRNYRQYCATARALDVIGERWTLLLIRELLTGPKRNKDLLENLPGIGTNLLASRLRYLEGSGLVVRTKLPPPAGSVVYQLTELGRGVEPIVMALARWGQNLLGAPCDEDEVRPSWSVLNMKALFRPERAAGIAESYEFRIDDDVFHVSIENGRANAAQGPAVDPDLVVKADTDTFLAVASGTLLPEQAVESSAAELVVGDLPTMKRCLHLFGIEPIT